MQRFILLFILPIILLARDWTVMVYMAADNGLSQWADSDLVEMEEIGSNDDIAILVQLDKPNIGAKRLYVAKDTTYSLGELGIIDMCDWRTLYDFLDWGICNYPAKRYFVILWDHGTGWTLMPRRTFGSDWSSGNQLSISNGDFQKSISNAYNSTGKKINLFAFDACLMQQIEVGYEIKDYAKIFLSPQTVWPLAGFPYNKILSTIKANPAINEVELAKGIVQSCKDNYAEIQPIAISAIRLEKLNKLKDCAVNLFNRLMLTLPTKKITELRNFVQTIPALGSVPHPKDDYIDLGDFVKLLHNQLANKATDDLLNAYNNTIVLSKYWGDNFARTTGLTIWFPDEYRQFKQLISYYKNLNWIQAKWHNFLNWFYNEDDIRPTDITINASKLGEDNNFRLTWNNSYDLAQIFYYLIEGTDTNLIFNDNCEDSSLWNFSGFMLTTDIFYSGNHSFFSGNASNLSNSLITKASISIEGFALFSLYLNYNTEDMKDSLIIEYGPYKDIYYGNSNGWIEHRLILPEGNYQLQLSYHTNASINNGGCYIDDIAIYNLKNGRYIRENLFDTTLYIFNKLKGDYLYAVLPIDHYENRGKVSNFVNISIVNYATPYSTPNPFQNDCDIILDYPDSLHPSVEIFSINGRLVKKFSSNAINNKKVHWDGQDENNREVGSGLYFIFIKDGSFKKIGKIARQR